MFEVGKTYTTASGERVGPMGPHSDERLVTAILPNSFKRASWFRETGKRYLRDPEHDLIAEWTDGPVFTVGAKVRVTSGEYGESQLGKTGRVVEVGRNSSLDVEIEYDEPLNGNGLRRNQYRSEHLELVAPTGPVRTVTRREVVPGVWSGVEVGGEVTGAPNGPSVLVSIGHRIDNTVLMDCDQLKAAAAVLLELAGALE